MLTHFCELSALQLTQNVGLLDGNVFEYNFVCAKKKRKENNHCWSLCTALNKMGYCIGHTKPSFMRYL